MAYRFLGCRAVVAAVLAAAVALPVTPAAPDLAAPRAVAPVAPLAVATPRPAVTDLGPLRVGPDGRSFIAADGAPFFWLADTAWSLFVNLDTGKTIRYLDERAHQGFTVIQAVAVFPHAGGPGPNAFGDDPVKDGLTPVETPGADPTDAEQYDFWDNVDAVVEMAAQRGMRIALSPVWADKQVGGIVTVANAREYGRFLGKRYSHRVVWVMGGDQGADGEEDIWRELAAGVATGANGSEDYTDLLMTYHPRGDQTSATWFHNDRWLSFNMLQGGHCKRWDNLLGLIEGNAAQNPVKPFLDGESIYEDHPLCWKPEDGFSTEHDVRNNAYWSVFGGAAGHTYGHHAVWQFLEADGSPQLGARGNWIDAMRFPAGTQMRHLRALMESRPQPARIPDQSLLAAPGRDVRATRDTTGAYLMVYAGDGESFAVNTSGLSGTTLRGWWFDPRTGTAVDAGEVRRAKSVKFSPPKVDDADGNDRVLVVDDAARQFPVPGTRPAVPVGPSVPVPPAAPVSPPMPAPVPVVPPVMAPVPPVPVAPAAPLPASPAPAPVPAPAVPQVPVLPAGPVAAQPPALPVAPAVPPVVVPSR